MLLSRSYGISFPDIVHHTFMKSYRFLFFALIVFCLLLFVGRELFFPIKNESMCYGTTPQGSLKNGVQMPYSGNNFVSYGLLPVILGRTYVHSKVRTVILSAYRMLEREQPGKVFKYAETGFKHGGPFKPHKTHQNGLSVDFMVPVLDATGQSIHLPTHLFNQYGYQIEFDNTGHFKGYTLDNEALSAHIVVLHKVAKQHGMDISRVIFDPLLTLRLYQTKYGPYLRKHINLSKKPSWVRHDEHYHVDFQVSCHTTHSKSFVSDKTSTP